MTELSLTVDDRLALTNVTITVGDRASVVKPKRMLGWITPIKCRENTGVNAG